MDVIRTVKPIGVRITEDMKPGAMRSSKGQIASQKMRVRSYQMDFDMAQQKISDSIYQLIESKNVHLDFEVDIDRGIILVKVVNEITGDVIREISLSTILYADTNMKGMRGMLFDREI